MSWAIKEAGQREGMKRRIDAAVQNIDDRQQQDAVRNFVVAAIDRLPSEVTGVAVKAYGQRDPLTYQLVIKIEPLDLALDVATTPTKP